MASNLLQIRGRYQSVSRWSVLSALATAVLVAPIETVALHSISFTRGAHAQAEEAVQPKVREAIDKALNYLRDNQKPDGTWDTKMSQTTAVPSLVVMAFLSRGHVPGQGPYGDLLYKSIDFVLDSQQTSGLLSRGTNGNAVMYEHGISMVMLSEAYGMVDDSHRAHIETALGKAAKLSIDAQKFQKNAPQFNGGWRYQIESPDADISVTGWQLMGLRGAANCGAAVPKDVLEAGREYVRRSAVKDGGFCYQPGGAPNPARTGTGILSMELLGQHASPEAIAAGDWLLKNWPDNPNMEFYFYSVYYNSQALNQLGGKYWTTLYPKLVNTLLSLQNPQSGVFAASSSPQENDAGDAYRTSMSVLALCVPFRYLPLYQR